VPVSKMHRSPHGLDTQRADNWADDMACRRHDPTMWDLPDGRGPGPDAREALSRRANRVALGVCLFLCPVRQACARDNADINHRGLIVAGVIHDWSARSRPGWPAEALMPAPEVA